VESPSARPWLGVGAALCALPAAGGCFCVALVLAVVADSDPGAVYEQHRWLGAVVAASVSCAYVAMMGWATLRHGGLPVPVLLMALALAGAPFLAPGELVAPAAALAVVGSAALAALGLQHPPASLDPSLIATAALTGTAVVLALGQAVLVGEVGSDRPPRAEVLAEGPMPAAPERPAMAPPMKEQPPADKPARAQPPVLAAPGNKVEDAEAPPIEFAPADEPAPAEDTAPAKDPAPTSDLAPSDDPGPAENPAPALDPAPSEDAAPSEDLAAAARDFVRDYYAAIDAHDFTAAWDMLLPDVQDAFGDFESWKKGYATTVSQAADGLRITPAGTSAIVGLTLRAGDRGACGKVAERRFAVTWWLVRTDAGLRATAASARKISGPEPC